MKTAVALNNLERFTVAELVDEAGLLAAELDGKIKLLDAIKARGGDAFSDYQVPLAILTLQQGLGRLIRHRGDRGVLAILDPRLRTARYGERFLASVFRLGEKIEGRPGVFLAFAAHFATVEISGGIPMQIFNSIAGILIMIATASLIAWYKRIEGGGRGTGSPKRQPNADLAGGEA